MDPIEIVTLRDPTRGEFVFAGWSNLWRPGAVLRDAIRDVCRQIGEALADNVNYRGFFSVDGIAIGEKEFLATEVNPRLASGLGVRSIDPEFPIYLFSRSLTAGLQIMWEPKLFETKLREQVAKNPSLSISLSLRDVDTSLSLDLPKEHLVGNRLVVKSPQNLRVGDLAGPVVKELAHRAGWTSLECYVAT